MKHRSILSALFLCSSLFTTLAQAGTCDANLQSANPDSAYSTSTDGTVTHKPTGLVWKRCAEGQTWSGSTCTGSSSTASWAQSLTLADVSSFAGQVDWRLPSIKELRSLVEECRINPSINNTTFPGTPSDDFWSGSSFAYQTNSAWSVNFFRGNAYAYPMSESKAVRLVRGGQPFSSFDAAGGTSLPTVASVTPMSGTVGTTVTITVTGSNFPNTLIVNISGQLTGCTRQSVNASQGTFACPLDLVGSKLIEVKTNTAANNGTVISSSNFTVNAATTNGLAAHYCFDDPSNLGKDCSTNGNNASRVSTVTSVLGVTGNAAKFAGTTLPGEFSIPPSPSLSSTSAISFSTFARIDSAGGMDGYGRVSAIGVHNIFAKSHDRIGGAANVNVQNGVLAAGFAGNSIFTGATTSTGTSSAPYTIGSWVHLAYVIETNSVKIYINGNLVATTTGTVNFATLNSQALSLGKYSDYWYPLNGALDDFKVYTRALSAAEVQSISQSNSIVTPTFTITSVTPTAARLDVLQQFTLTGTGLTSGMGFTIEDCEPSNQEVPNTGSATSRTFQCTPRLPGPKNLTIKTAPGGTVIPVAGVQTTPITIDQPSRLGDPSARGIPAVDAVSLWNGNVHLSATDLSVPGKGVSFALTRSYNSYDSGDSTQPTYEARHGSVSNAAPWRFNWDIQTKYVTDSTGGVITSQLSVQREDGSGESYFKDTDGIWYPTDQGNFNTFKGDTPVPGQSTLLTREGIKYIFQNPDLGGKLIGIFDHDGNGLTVARDGSNRVSTVTDASARNYTFGYDVNNRLVRVTDFSGRHVDYTWETSTSPVGAYLKAVTDVRGGVTTYNYANQNPASVTAPNKPTLQRLLTSVQDARLNTARTFTYTGNVYGNWGAASVTDAMGATWGFAYCAKQPGGTCTSVPNTAQSFETTMTPPAGAAATVTRFDTGGRPTANQQANNNSTLTRTTPLTVAGGLTPRTYNQASLPTKKESALGVAGGYFTALEYTADKLGDLFKRTDAEGATTARTWLTGAAANSAALLAKNLRRVETLTTATPGATHTFTHNNSGKVLTYTPPGLPATTLSYDPANGQLTSVKDARNNTSSRTYDANGNLKTVIDPEGRVAYSYDSLGRVLTTLDKRGAVTSQTWDADGNLLSSKDALNPVPVSYAYDANGNRTQMTDARGNVTNYSYDKNNRLTTISRVLGARTLSTTNYYDALGRVTSTVNANNNANSTTFDVSGNVLTRVNALADTTQYTYDADDRVTSTTDPVGRITTTSYDKVGRVVATTAGFGTAAAATTRYTYDGDGRMTSRTDPRGKLTQYGYDAAGRMTSVTDANNAVTRSTFDANGNALTITDPAGKTTSYTYDTLNRPLTRVDSNGQQWVTVYDLNGNVKTVTVPGNKTTVYTYDLLNRVSRIDYPAGSYASSVAYTYDPNGNRLTMVDSTGTTSYTYDALNRLGSKTDPQGKTVAYTYDGVGNVATLGYPGGQSVSYTYDAGERLVSLTDWLNKTTVYTLNRAGQVTTALLGNGARADMVYDGAGRLNSLVNKKPDNSVISSHQLTLDANGNITNSAVTLPLQPALVSATRALTYDNANRLATFNGSAASHDVAGRITSLSGATYSYNDRDQITTISGSQSASYYYNGDGHRVQRTVNGVTTRSVIDPNRGLPEVLAETDAAGTVQQRYVYGYGLVEQIDSANAASYYHFDPTGSTLALTNGTGVVTDSYAYTPYGETTSSGNTVNPFRYVGKLGVMDDGNGLQYMRARYYRPEVARFMSLDALAGDVGDPQSLNRYAYVLGNPVMRVDPSGLIGRDIAGSVTYGLAWGLAQSTRLVPEGAALINYGFYKPIACAAGDCSQITYEESRQTFGAPQYQKNVNNYASSFATGAKSVAEKGYDISKDKVKTWAAQVSTTANNMTVAIAEKKGVLVVVYILAEGTYKAVGDATEICPFARTAGGEAGKKLEAACETVELIKGAREKYKEVNGILKKIEG